jgi:cardiolipin synthase
MPRWVNLANCFTLLRLLLVPFVVRDIVEGFHVRALVLFFAAALTDVIDGALARSTGSTTQIGAYFDPIADKVLLSSVFVALAVAGIVPWWFVAIVFARDIVILAGVLAVMVLTKVRKFPPSQWGKLSTFVQIVTAISWMTRNAWPAPVLATVSDATLWVCVACTAASGFDYCLRGVHLIRAR